MRKLLFCLFAVPVLFLTSTVYAFSEPLGESGEVAQQTIVITGKVLDESGQPVIGATVMEKGTTHGVVTDFSGAFSLDVHAGATIVVTCVGYQDYTFAASSKGPWNIVLQEDLLMLEETVVTAFATQ